MSRAKSYFFKLLIKCWLSPVIKIAKHGNQGKILDILCKEIDNEDFFCSFRVRPKDSCDIPLLKHTSSKERVAIIIQGPICEYDSMTVKTIQFYKKLYPDYDIILSTWKDEKQELIEKCAKEGVIIVQSDKPASSGILNVNYQIINTLEGIKKAKELGATYVAKTRSDQRVCKPFVFNSLIELIDIFPPSGNTTQEKRIVTIPTNFGNMFTPYFMSDFFYFGSTNDILKLFSLNLDDRKNLKTNNAKSRKEFSAEMIPPEIYILKNFLKNHTSEVINDTVNSYWDSIKNYFLCVDVSMIDLYINKYEYSHNDNVIYGTYFENDDETRLLTHKFGFCEWLNLISGSMDYKDNYEVFSEVFLK